MRYGYWLPVFGGWLRNVEDEQMETSWAYVSRLARRSEEIGFDLTLIAELNLNDIKGPEEPSLDAWSTAAALAAVTHRLELMVAVRPTFHNPALLAKQAATLDQVSGGRFVLGLGVANTIMNGRFGIAPFAPLPMIEEYVGVVRAVLGGPTPSSDEYQSMLRRLSLEPCEPIFVSRDS